MYSVSDETRKPIFEGVQGENEAREIQFDVTAWVEELGEGVCTATAKRPTDTTPYPVTVTRSGNVVTWKPNSADTSIEGIGAFQLSFSIDSVVAKTRIWNTKVAPSLVGAGDPPDPYDDWIQDLRDIAAETLTYSQNAEGSAEDAEAWAVGQRGGVDVPSTDPTYENNAKYYAEQSAANQYGAYIVKSASGDIASFTDGADNVPMKSLKVTITPQQAGSGDPSPSNVRPITGTSTANVTVTGKNLLDPSTFINFANASINDGTITATESDTRAWYPVVMAYNGTTYVRVLAQGASQTSWTFVKDDTFNSIVFGHSGQQKDIKIKFPFDVPNGTYTISIEMVSATNPFSWKNMQIEVGSSATDYVPYTGTTTPVPLGQTVYGGTVYPISGELVIDSILITFDGTENGWVKYSTQTVYNSRFAINTLPLTGSGIIGISSHVPTLENGYINGNYIVHVNQGNGLQFNNVVDYYGLANNEVATWKAFLASQYANGTPFQILVHPATPTIVQLTPAQVATLLGTNNVWADCGSVEVEYRADPTLAYNELANVIVSLGGNL